MPKNTSVESHAHSNKYNQNHPMGDAGNKVYTLKNDSLAKFPSNSSRKSQVRELHSSKYPMGSPIHKQGHNSDQHYDFDPNSDTQQVYEMHQSKLAGHTLNNVDPGKNSPMYRGSNISGLADSNSLGLGEKNDGYRSGAIDHGQESVTSQRGLAEFGLGQSSPEKLEITKENFFNGHIKKGKNKKILHFFQPKSKYFHFIDIEKIQSALNSRVIFPETNS
jgi:hypothetical protein